jgi:hypothetical protein
VELWSINRVDGPSSRVSTKSATTRKGPLFEEGNMLLKEALDETLDENCLDEKHRE